MQDWGRRRGRGSPVSTLGVIRESGLGMKPGYGSEGLYARPQMPHDTICHLCTKCRLLAFNTLAKNKTKTCNRERGMGMLTCTCFTKFKLIITHK